MHTCDVCKTLTSIYLRQALPHVQAPLTSDAFLLGIIHVSPQVLEILGHWEERADRLDVKTYNVALSTLGKCGR